MESSATIAGLALFLLLGVIISQEIGLRLGRRNAGKHADKAYEGIGSIEATVFALLGLLFAFSLAGATERLGNRRQLIIQEANTIGTAYLRLDLLPVAEQPAMRTLFRSYLDARLWVYELIANPVASEAEQARAVALQGQIWSQAVSASRESPDRSTELLLLPAINDMIDITTTRATALTNHLPGLIVGLIVGLALVSGVVAGYGMSKRASRSWIHIVLYAALLAATLYVMLDLEYPRAGYIRVDSADRALYQLRDSIR